MRNPFKYSEPFAVSFSGGRTSGYMVHRLLDANGGSLPPGSVAIFANTGKEMPETLDFIHECETRWQLPMVWIELYQMTRTVIGDKVKLRPVFKIVNYETASRQGEPFDVLLDKMPPIPNPTNRMCTAVMKIRAIDQYLKATDWERPVMQMIGIRADEQRRAAKMRARDESGRDKYDRHFPLVAAGVTKEEVGKFWADNDFDLALPNNNGVTDWGNCDLCYLKAYQQKRSLIAARPDLAQWWIDAEEKKNGPFRLDHPSYQQFFEMRNQIDMFEFNDETIPCYCGD